MAPITKIRLAERGLWPCMAAVLLPPIGCVSQRNGGSSRCCCSLQTTTTSERKLNSTARNGTAVQHSEGGTSTSSQTTSAIDRDRPNGFSAAAHCSRLCLLGCRRATCGGPRCAQCCSNGYEVGRPRWWHSKHCAVRATQTQHSGPRTGRSLLSDLHCAALPARCTGRSRQLPAAIRHA